MRTCNDNKLYIARLKKINGQINGLIAMVEAGRSCEDLAMQILAAQNAMKNLGKLVIKNHLTHCVREGIQEGNESIVNEFSNILDKYI